MAKEGVPARQLWQVPVFLLGLTLLVTYLLVRPAWTDPVFRAEAKLDRARRLWENREPHVRKIVSLLQDYVTLAGPEGSRTAEARLIWGCTLARAARQLGPDGKHLWREAWEQLRLAQSSRDTLEGGDVSLMRANLGEVGYHVGHTRRWVQHWLGHYQDYADDRAEFCRLLVLVCLEANPPQLEAALEANEQLRQLPLLGEDVLGPARLQGGDILLRLKRYGEARKLLEKIGKDAPADILARSRTLGAESLQAEGQWAEAAALWQEMLEDKREVLNEPGRVLYQLGLCLRRLDQRDEAMHYWREVVKLDLGRYSAAAAMGLAELVLNEGGAELVEFLTRAVRGVEKADDWKNLHTGLPQARELYEQACKVLRQKRDHAGAIKVCEAYQKFAVEGRADWQGGLTLREWSQALREADKVDREQVKDLMWKAGEAFQAAADAIGEGTEQAERLWLAAEGFFDGGESASAVAALDRFLHLKDHPTERQGEGWYRLAQAQETLKNEKEAEAAYRRCMSYRGRFGCRARLRLGEIELARGKTDLAAEMLELNLKQLRVEHDDEALEKSLYLFGHLLYLQKVREVREKEPAAVRAVLEEAVSKYPKSSSQVRGRFELAETYRLLADQENQNIVQGGNLTPETREHFLKQRRSWLLKAAEQFQILNQLIDEKPTAAAVLKAGEQVHVAFSVAECRFNLGEYDTALKLYDDLGERYKNRLERLSALGGMARCYAAQRDFTQFKKQLEQIQLALQDVDEQTRRQWQAWLEVAGKKQ